MIKFLVFLQRRVTPAGYIMKNSQNEPQKKTDWRLLSVPTLFKNSNKLYASLTILHLLPYDFVHLYLKWSSVFCCVSSHGSFTLSACVFNLDDVKLEGLHLQKHKDRVLQTKDWKLHNQDKVKPRSAHMAKAWLRRGGYRYCPVGPHPSPVCPQHLLFWMFHDLCMLLL